MGHVTSFAYDALNRQTSQTDALTHTTTYSYDKVGLRISLTDANGQTTNYIYDGVNRLTTIDYPAPDAEVIFTYDAAGNRTQMVDGVGATTWTYDQLSRPITITDPFTGIVGYAYDILSNRTQLTYPDGKVVTDTYDALNRLTQVTDWNAQATTYAYNAIGQPITTTLPNGVTSAISYDAAHRLTSLTHTTLTDTLASYAYTVDTIGNRTQTQEGLVQPPATTITQTDNISYTYDSLYRVTDAMYANGEAFHYAYDPAGNVLTKTQTVGN